MAVAAIALLITSCAPAYVKPDYSVYAWPSPPQKARIRVLDIIASDLDVRQTSSSESIFGSFTYFNFIKPHGVAADAEGNIYVADLYRKDVSIINREAQTISTLVNPQGWSSPFGVAVDDKNKLLVVTDSNKAFVFNLTNKRLTGIIKDPKFRALNSAAIDPERKFIYICDTKGSAIYKYDFEGNFIQQVAYGGGGDAEVYYPAGVALDSKGTLYVTDTMHWKVKAYGPDGKFLHSWGVHGSVPGQFNRPKGISISKDDILIITDNDLNLFQLFTPTGQPYLYIGGPGSSPGRFAVPQGVFVDKNDRIYVADETNRRIQIFQMYTDTYYKELERQEAAMANSAGAISNASGAQGIVNPTGEPEPAAAPQGEGAAAQ